ncbi:hypothetical protein TNIN_296631 [Trichonephila inaurata madagascariensis]|uniref:Uncharacterized protein n=1 Tax=Trichonephila inaurata madagascariensis TaxID=2747483 RepID=A0A8X6YTM1_9ARAC|nr:hypothetical protein TNIN_296631 [Trichonephila inaurata madagascariensis]
MNGTQMKIDELSCLLHDNNVHVACLQETKLNLNLNLKIEGCTELRRDGMKSTGGGLTFLIKTPTIKYTEKEYTYMSKTNGSASALDITAMNLSNLDIAKWIVLKCAISDYFPIITSLDLNVDSAPQNVGTSVKPLGTDSLSA